MALGLIERHGIEIGTRRKGAVFSTNSVEFDKFFNYEKISKTKL